MTANTKEYVTAEHRKAMIRILTEFDRVCRALSIPYILFAGTLLGAVRHKGFIPWDDDLDVMMLRADYDRFLREAPAILDTENFFLQAAFSPKWPMFFSKLRLNGTTCLEKYHPKTEGTHQGVYIDIFPADDAAKTPLGRRLQFYASKVVIAKSLKARGYETDGFLKKAFMAAASLLPRRPFQKVVSGGHPDSDLVHCFFGGASDMKRSVFPKSMLENRTAAMFEGREYPIPSDYDKLLTILYGDYMTMPSEEERAVKAHAILVDPHHSYEMYEHYRDGMKFDVYTRSIR